MLGDIMAGTILLPIWQQQLYRLSQDEAWSGEVEAPTGAFIDLIITPTEADLLGIAREAINGGTGPIDQHWMIYEDSNGFLTFVPYERRSDLMKALHEVTMRYYAWSYEEVTSEPTSSVGR